MAVLMEQSHLHLEDTACQACAWLALPEGMGTSFPPLCSCEGVPHCSVLQETTHGAKQLFLAALEFEPRALSMVGKHSTS
jgi:hypothetical protein